MKKYTNIEINYYKQRIQHIIIKHPRAFGHILQSQKNKDIIIFLNDMFPQLTIGNYKLKTKLYWLFNDISDFPKCKCPGCSNKILKNAFFYNSYPSYCSRVCASKDPIIVQKIQNTNLKRHGVKCTLQSEKSWNAIHQSIITKYGGTSGNIWETEYGKNKCKQTKLQKNNGKFESQKTIQQRKTTIINKYGGTSGNIWETEYGKNKCKNTWKNKYGYAHPNQHPKKRKYISEYMQSNQIQEKRNTTMKQNHSFNKSSSEERSYQLLIEKFDENDVFRQYSDERYPYQCDFYIKSLDLFIECNYHWTHGGHFFDVNSDSDNILLDKWKSKHTKFYDNAIKVWTVRDVAKNECSKNNNLNYLVFWKYQELENWVKNYI